MWQETEALSFSPGRVTGGNIPDIWWGNAGLTAVKRLTNRNPQAAVQLGLSECGSGVEKITMGNVENQGALYISPKTLIPPGLTLMIVYFGETHSHDSA